MSRKTDDNWVVPMCGYVIITYIGWVNNPTGQKES